MYKAKTLLFMRTLTSTHPGTGQAMGVVDLPIQRERHTGFPKIEASSLKGAIRDYFETKFAGKDKLIKAVFGPSETEKASEHASSIAFSDARILFFPVRSLKGVFAYVTSPAVLLEFKEITEVVGRKGYGIGSFNVSNQQIYVYDGSYLTVEVDESKKVVLEEFAFEAATGSKEFEDFVESIAQDLPFDSGLRDEFKKRAVMVSNDVFSYFVNYATEVVTRVAIDNNTGTVKEGALFTEEFLPPETIMYAMVASTDLRLSNPRGNENNISQELGNGSANSVLEFIKKSLKSSFQLGGDETLGKGIIKVKWL